MKDPLVPARVRALALAEAGGHALWPLIAGALATEGFSAKVITQLGKDRAFQNEITARIHAAIVRDPAAPAQTWRIRDPESRAKLMSDE